MFNLINKDFLFADFENAQKLKKNLFEQTAPLVRSTCSLQCEARSVRVTLTLSGGQWAAEIIDDPTNEEPGEKPSYLLVNKVLGSSVQLWVLGRAGWSDVQADADCSLLPRSYITPIVYSHHSEEVLSPVTETTLVTSDQNVTVCQSLNNSQIWRVIMDGRCLGGSIACTGLGRVSDSVTIPLSSERSGNARPSGASLSWTPGLLDPRLLGQTNGGKICKTLTMDQYIFFP